MAETSNHTKFKSSLLSVSVSDSYLEAVKEWNLDFVFIDDSNCICGMHIKRCCQIRNSKNNKKLIVGSVCVKKFLGIQNDFLFKIPTIRDKYNYKYIEMLHGRSLINDWEATFLVNLTKFHKISVKQQNLMLKIDKKVNEILHKE